jgi:serine/threonine protein kinase/tetratricopeptide (TPR) repeat protein
MSDSFTVLEQIFHAAMALPAEERDAYVSACCAGDARLQQDVEALIRHAAHDTASLHEHVAPVAASLLERHARPSLPPDTMLGPYRVERVLGSGGMGVVYLAVDTRLGRRVAVKTMRGGSGGAADGIDHLFNEARAAAALVHPNVAGLYDCGLTDGIPWFVMEYVAGVSLRSVLRPGGLPEAEVVRHAAQIAAALEYAHARGLIHGDIKPENLLLTDDGIVKVIDFGLARDAHVRPQESDGSPPLGGTLRYMAPELLAGETPTPAADIYSVGVLLHEMATGERGGAGFDGALQTPAGTDERGTMARLPNHRRIAGVIDRCLSLASAARYRNGAELAAALAGATEQAPPLTDRKQPPRLVILDLLCTSGGDGWLGTAIAESVAASLARLDSVSVATRRRAHDVIARDAAAPEQAMAAVDLGRALAAQWVISGTYAQSGATIRISPTLVQVSTGTEHRLAAVEGLLQAVFDMQESVVAALLEALDIGARDLASRDERHVDTRNLPAYEHYGRGKHCLYRMAADALSDAIRHFEQAVQLDSGYALAYSGLGTAYSLQFLRTSNPDDVARASTNLERATSLDPTLGEPYPWLVNLRFRQNQPAGALEAAAKGVALQPDLPEAHYFCGGIHYMMAEYPHCDVRTAPRRLAECIRLEPLFHPAWIVLGATATFLGQHATAVAILSEAMALEAEPDLAYRFVGAHTLRGIALARFGDEAGARRTLQEALGVLERREHLYRETFRVLSYCALGDIALRAGDPEEALAHFRHARRITTDTPRVVGSSRLTIRADAGLAAAYAAAGAVARGLQLADEAIARLETVASHTGTITFECGLGQLCLDLSLAHVRLGRPDEAAALLARGLASGWRDRTRIASDPELQPLHAHPAVARAMAALPDDPGPSIDVPVRHTRISRR